ncbi:MAG: DUF4111 domain-containing protein [Phenylobacterium sp.]|nr:MAG: DUF4111 domain-containing protein [Phenylobacterium sp.]
MPKSKDLRAPAREPTPFAQLNAVLAPLVGEARALLGDNFIGAYLQGSFAVGDADRYSDCDFIIVIRRDLTPEELPPFQAMHAAIHEIPDNPWRNQLEGSYAPAEALRRWSTTPRDPPGEDRGEDWGDPGMSGAPARAYPFWYLDHGAKTLVRSEHDNSQVVRWCLREKGVVLAGPDPRELVDPVPAEALRAEIRHTMALCATLELEPMALAAWQVFWVGLYCRMLHTLTIGKVASKAAGLSWAQGALDPVWSGLIGRAKALRKGMAEAAHPADPDDVAATRAFVRYAIEWAEHRARTQAAIAQRLALARAGTPRFDPRGRGGPGRGQHAPPAFRPNGRGRRG